MTASRHAIFVPLDADETAEISRAARQLGWDPSRVRVARRSLDARKGHPIGHRVEIELATAADGPELPPPRKPGRARSVVVIGSGPAGTFAALRFAEAGVRVTLVERGKPVQPRRHDLAALTQRGALDPTSNYCFGEGGAGTFSDGKLYTRSKDKQGVRAVLETLVAHGAAPSILVDSRPHIGSNHLPRILVALRTHLEASGVEYVWSDSVTRLIIDGGAVRGVATAAGRELSADAVVLAVGHSARDLVAALHEQCVALEAKAFALGARVEHPQPMIDRLQYGRAAGHPKLPPAFYQIATQVDAPGAGPRGVYSFCMCPGGWVVNSSTEAGELCTNGMSLSRRDAPRANAAMVVTVEPRDYGGGPSAPLAGIELQRSIERRAFELGGGGFVAPAQRVRDFLAARPSDVLLDTSYRPRAIAGSVRDALPPYVALALDGALAHFDRMLPGFAREEAQLVGVETRSSSPVRVVRGDGYESPSHAGLYPIGEGAGYAGGIVSAAIDGLRAADAMLARW
jgi:uncharacterized FAD-dependent dehydrogenase